MSEARASLNLNRLFLLSIGFQQELIIRTIDTFLKDFVVFIKTKLFCFGGFYKPIGVKLVNKIL